MRPSGFGALALERYLKCAQGWELRSGQLGDARGPGCEQRWRASPHSQTRRSVCPRLAGLGRASGGDSDAPRSTQPAPPGALAPAFPMERPGPAPRGPGSARGGGRGLDDPGPQRPACPDHLAKLRLTGARSLESPPARRLPPDPITPRGVGQLAGLGRGAAGRARGATSSPPPPRGVRPRARAGGGAPISGRGAAACVA